MPERPFKPTCGYALALINPGANLDSNLPNFNIAHLCYFWHTRVFKNPTRRFSPLYQDIISIHAGAYCALFSRNRTFELAFCPARNSYCLFTPLNADIVTLCALSASAMGKIQFRQTEHDATAKPRRYVG